MDLGAAAPGHTSGSGLPLVHGTAGSALSGRGPPGQKGKRAERPHSSLGPNRGPRHVDEGVG